MRAREFTEPQAAGCIIVAADTGRWCLQQRSRTVTDPGVWSTWGGGREPGESVSQCVRRELAEESGYSGPVRLEPVDSNGTYATFLAHVPHEFEPELNSESQAYQWSDPDDLPEPLHPGLQQTLGVLAKNSIVPTGVLSEIYKMPPTNNSSQGMTVWAYTDSLEKKSPVIYKNDNVVIFKESENLLRYIILQNGNPILYLGLSKFLDGYKSGVVAVELPGRGKGLAQQAYLDASDILNVPIYSDATQTDASRLGIWDKLIQQHPDRIVGYDQKTNQDLPLTVHNNSPAVNQNQPIYVNRNKKDANNPVTPAQRYRTRILKLLPKKQRVSESSFDRCYNQSCRLYDRAEKQGLEPKQIQVAGFLGDGSSADPRWLRLPQQVWKHYVVVVGDTVLDPTADQFGPNMPKKYPVQDLDRLWDQQYQIRPKELEENFADGKVKGKSRPGRVKRAGASCTGSVTDLRARAKKYSGERAKMYHWCANMKSGKNKKK
jgi:8-oxo-dGTP pyrophosphatase MutT (NUDIX family)